jgi:ketosteroid isomerase-like protein
MSEGVDIGLVRDMFSAANRAAETGRLDDWLSFFSENVVWEAAEDAPDAGTYRGREGVRGYLQDWLDTVDGWRADLRGLTEVGDRAVADIHLSARVKGTGTEIALDYSAVAWSEGGKITRGKEFLEHDAAVAYAEAAERGGS